MSQADWISGRIAEFGDRTFLTRGDRHHSFAELAAEVDVAKKEIIQADIPEGACVALLGDYSLEAIAAFIALHLNGNILVPMTGLPQEELRQRMAEAHVQWILKAEDTKYAIEKLIPDGDMPTMLADLQSAGHSGLILFSSGSTGRPKAMVHDLQELLAVYRDKRPRALTMLVFLLFDHIGGLNTLLNGLATGAHLVIPESRDPEEVATLIEREKVRILPASPTFLNLLLLSGAVARHDLSSLRIITYGTEPMPESLLAKLKAAFPRTKLLQTFGTSETGISQTVSRSSSSLEMKIDDPNTEFKVVEGELWLRSTTQIRGYLNASMERFTEDGWFRTGDQVELTDDGFIRILGRDSEIINVGGEKVMPAEVESVLLEVPEVRDCIVFGKPNPITGQVVAAEVVGAKDIEARELSRSIKRYCRSRIAPYKVPVYIEVVESLQSTGRFKKIRRR
ncbi:MAG: class I adenylate-forming enzyme family protein [Puniceicoccaceae bacterium]